MFSLAELSVELVSIIPAKYVSSWENSKVVQISGFSA